MGQKHDVRRSFVQQVRSDAASVALQKKDAVPKYWICEHADLPDVYKNCGMTDVVNIYQRA